MVKANTKRKALKVHIALFSSALQHPDIISIRHIVQYLCPSTTIDYITHPSCLTRELYLSTYEIMESTRICRQPRADFPTDPYWPGRAHTSCFCASNTTLSVFSLHQALERNVASIIKIRGFLPCAQENERSRVYCRMHIDTVVSDARISPA